MAALRESPVTMVTMAPATPEFVFLPRERNANGCCDSHHSHAWGGKGPWRLQKRRLPVTMVLTVGPDTAAAGAGGAFRRPGGQSRVTQNVVANEEMTMTKNQHRSFAAWLRKQRSRDDPVGRPGP